MIFAKNKISYNSHTIKGSKAYISRCQSKLILLSTPQRIYVSELATSPLQVPTWAPNPSTGFQDSKLHPFKCPNILKSQRPRWFQAHLQPCDKLCSTNISGVCASSLGCSSDSLGASSGASVSWTFSEKTDRVETLPRRLPVCERECQLTGWKWRYNQMSCIGINISLKYNMLKSRSARWHTNTEAILTTRTVKKRSRITRRLAWNPTPVPRRVAQCMSRYPSKNTWNAFHYWRCFTVGNGLQSILWIFMGCNRHSGTVLNISMRELWAGRKSFSHHEKIRTHQSIPQNAENPIWRKYVMSTSQCGPQRKAVVRCARPDTGAWQAQLPPVRIRLKWPQVWRDAKWSLFTTGHLIFLLGKVLLQKDPWRPKKPLASIKGCQKHTFPWQPRLSKVFPTHGFFSSSSYLHPPKECFLVVDSLKIQVYNENPTLCVAWSRGEFVKLPSCVYAQLGAVLHATRRGMNVGNSRCSWKPSWRMTQSEYYSKCRLKKHFSIFAHILGTLLHIQYRYT